MTIKKRELSIDIGERTAGVELSGPPKYPQSINEPREPTERQDILAKRPIRYKILAIFVALFFSIGSHFSTEALSANKSKFKKDLRFNNTKYGVIQAAMYLINTIMPLFGGMLMDRFGTVYGAVVSNSLILFGNILVLIGCYVPEGDAAFRVMVAGRIFHGFGSGIIVVAQQTILSKWFSNSYLGVIIGIQISASRFSNWLAQAITPKIVESFNHVAAAVWSCVIACVLSLVATLLYAFVLNRAGGEVISAKAKSASFSIRRLLYLPLGFWIVPFSYMIIAGLSKPFMSAVAEYIKMTYPDKTRSEAQNEVVSGFKSSVALVVPIFLSPIQGGLLDMFGKRSWIIILSTAFLVAAFAILPLGENYLYFGLVLFSIGKCIGPIATISSVAIMLPPEMISTGIGAGKSLANIGVALMHLIVGLVQDHTPKNDYRHVLPLLLYMSIAGLLLSFIYFYYNRRVMHNLFDVPVSQRPALVDQYRNEFIVHRTVDQLPHPKFGQKLFLTIITILLIICWSVFLYCLTHSVNFAKKIVKG